MTDQSAQQPWLESAIMSTNASSFDQSSFAGEIETGFPEPFCRYRNTTLRHPDAKFGDEACLGFDMRHDNKFQRRRAHSRYRHTTSWGSLDPATGEVPAASDFDIVGPLMGPGRHALARVMTTFALTRPESSSSSSTNGFAADEHAVSHYRADSVDSVDGVDSDGAEPTPEPDFAMDADAMAGSRFLGGKKGLLSVFRRARLRSRSPSLDADLSGVYD